MYKNILRTVAVIAISLSVFAYASSAQAEKPDSPMTVKGAHTINAKEAKAKFDHEVTFIDTRKGSDFEAGRIPGAVHLELKKVFSEKTLAEHVGKHDEVVFYCNGHKCLRSSKATKHAVEWGYTKVYYFRDGFPAWKSAGYPVE